MSKVGTRVSLYKTLGSMIAMLVLITTLPSKVGWAQGSEPPHNPFAPSTLSAPSAMPIPENGPVSEFAVISTEEVPRTWIEDLEVLSQQVVDGSLSPEATYPRFLTVANEHDRRFERSVGRLNSPAAQLVRDHWPQVIKLHPAIAIPLLAAQPPEALENKLLAAGAQLSDKREVAVVQVALLMSILGRMEVTISSRLRMTYALGATQIAMIIASFAIKPSGIIEYLVSSSSGDLAFTRFVVSTTVNLLASAAAGITIYSEVERRLGYNRRRLREFGRLNVLTESIIATGVDAHIVVNALKEDMALVCQLSVLNLLNEVSPGQP